MVPYVSLQQRFVNEMTAMLQRFTTEWHTIWMSGLREEVTHAAPVEARPLDRQIGAPTGERQGFLSVCYRNPITDGGRPLLDLFG